MVDKKEHVYRGVRIKEQPNAVGECHVYVDGKPLRHVVHHSPDGFNWGYGGSGPADLALSILAHHFGETPTKDQIYQGWCLCWFYHQYFKWVFVSLIQDDEWETNSDMVQAAIDQINEDKSPDWLARAKNLRDFPNIDDYYEALEGQEHRIF